MAFMSPEYTDETFATFEHPRTHELCNVPIDCKGDMLAEGYELAGTYHGKWWVRLSASGYMDCTDWDGPFDTEDEAREHVREFWEVDPDTGDELTDDAE